MEKPQQTLRLFDAPWNEKLGKKIIESLPSELQSGSIFINSNDLLVYLAIIAISCGAFFVSF